MQQSFKLAIKSIWGNKMRSFLTMLGIIIGVSAVIILVSVVSGYLSYMTESFASLGVDQITLNIINLPSRNVSVDEMYEFYDENTDLFGSMTPTISIRGVAKNGNDSLDSTSITGVSEDYQEIKDWELEYGRGLQYIDMSARHKVCVIGIYVANELYGGAEKACGETIKINGTAFTIVGVIEQQNKEELSEGGTDDFVWIPYTCATKLARNAYVNNYIITVNDLDKVSECKTALKNFLYEKMKNEDLYTVEATSDMLDEINSLVTTASVGLGGIAGISLLVAGVGVMNIMLVSVTERTREIGIRKALGARRSVILQQFVIEAAVTSSIGGVIGIAVGCGVIFLINRFNTTFQSTPTFSAIAVSFAVSVGIGLLFGYMPASRASKLNPIDALRSE